MNNTGTTNINYNNVWSFIEDFLPNYSFRDDILRDDILLKYLENEYVSEDDLQWIKDEFNGNKQLIKEELIKLEIGFMTEAIRAYYDYIEVK